MSIARSCRWVRIEEIQFKKGFEIIISCTTNLEKILCIFILDFIEVLKIDTNGNGSDWESYGTLPRPLLGHTMTLLRNEIVLIGGRKSNGEWTNEVWKGIIQGNEISFEPLPSMKNKRSNHFAFAYINKLSRSDLYKTTTFLISSKYL